MTIYLNPNYDAITSNPLLGYVGENNSREICFEGLKVNGADYYKIRFHYPDKIEYDVEIIDNKIIVGGSLLRMAGEIKAQIIAYKSVGDTYQLVRKSNIFYLIIRQSLDESVAPVPSYEQTLELLEVLSNKLIVCDYADLPQCGIEGAIYAAQDKHIFYAWDSKSKRYIPWATGGEGGTANYEDLLNLPLFNGVTIIGDKADEDYGIIGITNAELEKVLK